MGSVPSGHFGGVVLGPAISKDPEPFCSEASLFKFVILKMRNVPKRFNIINNLLDFEVIDLSSQVKV